MTILIVAAASAVIGAGWILSKPVPAQLGEPPIDLDATSLTFRSDSGSVIHGWITKGRAHRGVVLLLPGVRDNRRGMLQRARFLKDAGHSVLLIDFQATGESPGAQITFGWLERLDVIAAVNEIRKQIPDEHIGVVGVSLGGAATLLAARELQIDAAVLEAVYPSIEAAIDNRLRMRLGRAGTVLSPLLLMQLSPRLGISAKDLRPAAHIGDLRCPVLIIAGADDIHTTKDDTQQLFDAAVEPKELWLIPGADHNTYTRVAGDAYAARLLAFFDRTLRRES